MAILGQFIFWLCVAAIAHSYVIYPLLLRLFARGRKINQDSYSRNDQNLPTVTIMMAVYNEEAVLREKLESLFNTNYPLHLIKILIGSDSSVDKTHDILDDFCQKYPDQISYQIFKRQGKPNILNALHQETTGDISIFTDANVFFTPDTIFHLVKHFKNEEIGLVGANFKDKRTAKNGIGEQEDTYIRSETKSKYYEGVIWGTMMGAFGGCYAIRANLFVQNPPNFIVEDFYLSMHIMAEGKKAILDLDAIVYEDVSTAITEEFRRKIRISTGNYQNLSVFYRVLFGSALKGLSFTFWSHKVLRWLGPFFILGAFVSSGLLGLLSQNLYYQILFGLITFGLIGIPFLDWIFKRLNINIFLLRAIAYFNAMNVALFIGFFKYLKGVKSNVWEPTKRSSGT